MSEVTNLSADDIERIENNYDTLQYKLAAIQTATEETIPGGVVDRLMAGEVPLTVWRQHRGLSREALADSARVSLAEIERVEDHGHDIGLRPMVALARALRLDAEELLPWLETAEAE